MEYNIKQKVRETFKEHPFVARLTSDNEIERFLKFLDSFGFTCRDGRPCTRLRPRNYRGRIYVYVKGTITWCDCYVSRDKYPTLIQGAQRSIRFIKDVISKFVLNQI